MRLRPFSLEAIVLLPDRLHCVWTLPEGTVIFLAGGGAKAVVSRAVAHEVEALPTARARPWASPASGKGAIGSI
jgi:putative transposase